MFRGRTHDGGNSISFCVASTGAFGEEEEDQFDHGGKCFTFSSSSSRRTEPAAVFSVDVIVPRKLVE